LYFVHVWLLPYPMCIILKCGLGCKLNFSYLGLDYLTYRLNVIGLGRVCCGRHRAYWAVYTRYDMKYRLQIEFLPSWYMSALICHMAGGLESVSVMTSDIMWVRLGFLLLDVIFNFVLHLQENLLAVGAHCGCVLLAVSELMTIQ
jgi:hypothetical protein